MAKQRNSLGLCVLPWITGIYTWAEYKERFGVDLEKIFDVVNTGDDDDPLWMIGFKRSFTKIIALSAMEEYTFLPTICVAVQIKHAPDATQSSASVSLASVDVDNEYSFRLDIYANKTIHGGEI